MRLTKVKTSGDIKLKGVTPEVDTVDGSLKRVRLTDAEGTCVEFCCDSYSLSCSVKAPPKMVDKWRVSATPEGLPAICELFDDQYAANNRRTDICSKITNLASDDVKVEKVSVEEPE